MLWKNWLINRLGSLVIVAGPRQARFFHGPFSEDGLCLLKDTTLYGYTQVVCIDEAVCIIVYRLVNCIDIE